MLLTLAALAAAAFLGAGPGVAGAAAQLTNGELPEVVGIGHVGQRLVCGSGSWSGVVTEFQYRWVRDGVQVAHGLNYYRVSTADEGHSIWCIVTAVIVKSASREEAEAESYNSIFVPSEHPQERLLVPLEAPEVTGSPLVGKTLGCTTGRWEGVPSSYKFQWFRNWGLPGQTALGAPSSTSTHLVGTEDEGYVLSCVVTAENSYGAVSEHSSNGTAIPGTAPVNTVAPRVFGPTRPAVGESLTCSKGTWTGHPPPTYAYEWLRDGQAIAGASAETYAVAPSDQLTALSCAVLATNSAGKAEAASSNSVEPPGSAPRNGVAPALTPASADVGETFTCAKGTWTGVPEPTYTYVWVRDLGQLDETAVGAGAAEAYVAVEADRGHTLTCEVTAQNSEGHATAISNTAVVRGDGIAPAVEEAPELTGAPAVGDTLTCAPGRWSGTPAPSLGEAWLRDGVAVPGATGERYVVTKADQGHSLTCLVTAINEAGIASQPSNVVEVPGEAPSPIQPPSVSGEATVGSQLTCAPGKWGGEPLPALAYQWLRDGADIPSATAGAYTVTEADRGRMLACEVTASNSAGEAEARSNEVEVPGLAPTLVTKPEVTGAPAIGETLTCSPGTWNAAPAPTYAYQWVLNGTEVPGATEATFVPSKPEQGLELECQVVASNEAGESKPARSAPVQIEGGAKPRAIEAPHVAGSPGLGEQLTCEHGSWEAEPPPAFTYQWLRDGAAIQSATASTYTVALADQGHLVSCRVTAVNSQGSAEAQSSNSYAIASPAPHPETTVPELSFPPAPEVIAPLTTAQILTSLKALTHAQHAARLSRVRKAGGYTFTFVAPGAGTFEFSWYATSSGAGHASRASALRLATATQPCAAAGRQTVKLRLTSAGRRALAKGKQITLTVKAVFTPAHGRPVTWTETTVLSH